MSEDTVSRIAVQRIDIPERWLVISVEKVVYAFLGSAVTRAVIDAPWAGGRALAAQTVYVRTIDGALFRTGFATLDALRRRLDPATFMSIHRFVIVNVNRLVEIDLGANLSRIGVLLGTGVEFIPISRRRLKTLRELIGFPKRRPRSRERTPSR